MKNYNCIRNFTSLVLLMFIFGNKPSAQQLSLLKGHYITLTRDTISGFFNMQDLTENALYFYKNKEDTNPIDLFPENLQEVGLENELHVLSKEIMYNGQTEHIFILQKLKGNINFYIGYSKNEGKIFFINTVDHPEIIRINRQAPGFFLKNYLGECEHTTAPHLVRYHENGLQKEIQKYHQCLYPEATYTLATSTTSLRLGFGVQGIGFFSKAKILGYYEGTYAITMGGGAGLIARLKLSSSVSVNIGFNYVHKIISQPDSIDYIKPNTKETVLGYRAPIKFTYAQLMVPVSITYYFNKTNKQIFPTIGAGASYGRSTRVKVVNDFPSLNTGNKIFPQENAVSFFIESGISKTINKRSSIELMINYAFELEGFNKVSAAKFDVTTNRLALILGYYF